MRKITKEELEAGNEVLHTMIPIMNQFDEVYNLAFLATMFDHICEHNHIDKHETLDLLVAMILTMNEKKGNMYPRKKGFDA